MNYTVSDLADETRREIRALADEIGTLKETYEQLAEVSGLSLSWVTKFYQRAKDNPRQDTLDRLIRAVRVLRLRLGKQAA